MNTEGFTPKKNENIEKLPEVSSENPLKLVGLNTQSAFFKDITGKHWYMDIKKMLWREMDVMDLHPMALQFKTPIEFEKSNFESIEDAINYTQRLYFENEVKRSLSDVEYFENSDSENKEEAVALFKEHAERCSALIELMKKYEEATEDDARLDLMTQIKTNITELREFNGGEL